MVRFIFVCMGVVALSLLSLAGQFMLDDINEAQSQIAARNNAAPETDVVAVETAVNPEDLNDIETAAGSSSNDEPGNQTFGNAFSSDTPAALKEEEAPPLETSPIEDVAY